MYRTPLFAIALIVSSAAYAAQAPQPAEPEEIRIPPELTDPRFVERIAGMTEALSKALLDLPVGELQAAAEGRPATSADRRRTVRDVSRLSERDVEQQIAQARPRVEAAMQAFARALPAMTKALSEAADEVERATANMPQPGYPRR
ncbi:MAG TPA: hypothetical protein VFU80_00770 [Sphingomicrobium sp.]|nr:hypothetical protein [Sphingomicrobium sp.]